MFTYPKQAEFDRVVPKTRIFAHAKASKRIKDLFGAQVEQILWKYKLAPETINLPARDGIKEIQVFSFLLKTPEFDLEILEVIDKAIPFPLLFQLFHGDQVCFAVSYKRPSAAKPGQWVTEAIFTTPFHHSSLILLPLPLALDLAALYEQLVRRHIPLPARAEEDFAAHVARFNALETKKKALSQLQTKLAQEKQFNRKVELNTALRSVSQELTALEQP